MARVVLITGVAGGIGRATAEVFDKAGWYVIGVDRESGRPVPGVSCLINEDVSEARAFKVVVNEIMEQTARLDAVVNNAAIQVCAPLMETTVEQWDAIMASNLRSVFLSLHETYELLRQEGGGAVVNVGSVHALATSVGLGAYAASKGALLALTRAMALELAPDGIRVNAVLPGAIDTPMLHAGLSRGHVEGGSVTELVRALGEKHVLGRIGRPQEAGEAILFCADSERSSFMTGQSLVVDGGATARLSTE